MYVLKWIFIAVMMTAITQAAQVTMVAKHKEIKKLLWEGNLWTS